MDTAKTKSIEPLSPEQLRRRTDPEQLNFASTADLPELPIFVGQERPISAIHFGVKMNRPGYNIFALGPAGLGKYTLVRNAVQERAAAEPPFEHQAVGFRLADLATRLADFVDNVLN